MWNKVNTGILGIFRARVHQPVNCADEDMNKCVRVAIECRFTRLLEYRILEKEAAGSAHDPWELADKIRAAFGGRRFSDSAALIREDRDR